MATDENIQLFKNYMAREICNPLVNPYGGSVRVETINTQMKKKYTELYKAIFDGKKNKFIKFIKNNCGDIFDLLTLYNENDKCSGYRIKLAGNKKYIAGDLKEINYKEYQTHFILIIICTLASKKFNNIIDLDTVYKKYDTFAQLYIDELYKQYNEHFEFISLPKRGDLIRILLKFIRYFPSLMNIFNDMVDKNTPYTIYIYVNIGSIYEFIPLWWYPYVNF